MLFRSSYASHIDCFGASYDASAALFGAPVFFLDTFGPLRTAVLPFGRPLFFFFSTGVKKSTIIRSLTFRSGAHCGTPLITLG